MRRLLVGLVIVGALAVIGDAVARSAAESRLASEIERTFDLEREPDVSLEGWPFLARVVAGSFPRVEMGLGSVGRGTIELESVEVVFHQVSFPLSAVTGDASGSISAQSGEGRAAISGEAATAALEEQGIPATVDFRDDQAFLSGMGFEDVPARLSTDGRVLTIASDQGSFQVELPEVVEGLRYPSVTVEGDRAVLMIRLQGSALRLGS